MIFVTGTAANQKPKFTTTDTKLYFPVVALLTQYYVKLLKQLEPGSFFKKAGFKKITETNINLK